MQPFLEAYQIGLLAKHSMPVYDVTVSKKIAVTYFVNFYLVKSQIVFKGKSTVFF